jgi:hypothetical protein
MATITISIRNEKKEYVIGDKDAENLKNLVWALECLDVYRMNEFN